MAEHTHSIPVQRVRPGDHACMEFTDDDARWEVVTVYARAGLSRGEKVMIALAPDDLKDDEAVARLDDGTGNAGAARRNGQLVVARDTVVYMPDGRFDKERQIRTWAGVQAQVRAEGYPGLRVAADASFATRARVEDELLDYEASVGPMFADAELTALCWYNRHQFSGRVVAASRKIHPIQVMERMGALEVTASPDGTRIAGSAGPDTRTEFSTALEELLGQRPANTAFRLELDLTDLCYIEADCAWQLIEFSGSLPPGHKLVVRCDPALEMALRGVGADDVPQLELMVEDQQGATS